MTEHSRRIPRREFLKSAVAIGGAAALSACTARENAGGETTTTLDMPSGPSDLSTLPERQHAWGEYLSKDDHGNAVAPRHHVLVSMNYPGSGTPSKSDRETVESALRTLERAFERGNDGLLFTVGYSRKYFERYDGPLPDSVDLPRPEPLAPFENPDPDEPDLMLHLASDHAEAVLAAEEAGVKGKKETLNGEDVTASLSDVLERVDRRTGFVGAGLPAKHQDVGGIPDDKPVDEDAPLYMGFKSAYKENQATEDQVTIGEGPFAEGTTEHVSNLSLNLNQWYNQDSRFQRVAKMYAPTHAKEDLVEGIGDNLGTDSKMDRAQDVMTAARTDGMVGHSQKMVSARDDDEPVILRRDFDSTDAIGDEKHANLHFVSLHETISDFVDTREAMNGTEVTKKSAVGARNNNGILQYIEANLRGNYLVPPRSLRALPPANP